MAREWGGSRAVLQDLPEEYFPGGELSLEEVDFEGRWGGVDPRYWVVMGEVLSEVASVELVGPMTHSDKSILVLNNLVGYRIRAVEGQDEQGKKIGEYMQKTVVSIYFGSYY